MPKKISLVVVVAENGVIGKDVEFKVLMLSNNRF